MKTKPRIMIAATGSGIGKTTVCCGILRGLTQLGYQVGAFKSGPDYIDPMFHTKVIGIPSRNLDLFMLGEEKVNYLLERQLAQVDIGVIEGAMGFYDGISNTSIASAHHLSEVTKTPVVLIVDCKGMARSVVAMVKGYLTLEPNRICAIILNGIKPGMYDFYKKLLEESLHISVLGYLPHMKNCELGSRHLGLITPDTITSLQEVLDCIAQQALESIDFKKLIEMASQAEALESQNEIQIEKVGDAIRIGIAKDEAFCFYYEDSIELLEEMGVEFVPFSPLRDEHLPKDLDGLWLGGGYPELYGEILENNITFKHELRHLLGKGIPCIAECGGFMYLQEELVDLEGQAYKMVGYLKGKSTMTRKLQPFGYITLTATKDQLLGPKGIQINAHEFHYSESERAGDSFVATKPLSRRRWEAGVANDHLYAGYPHFHLWGNLELAFHYVKACKAFQDKREEEGSDEKRN